MKLSEQQKEKLTAAVMSCMGMASACWENVAAAGRFKDEMAVDIGDELVAAIVEIVEGRL